MSPYAPAFADRLRQSERAYRASLTPRDWEELYLKARSWSLGPILASGGSAIFPHASFPVCGHQIAAVAESCLDSGADQILALGVLHPLTDPLWDARTRVLEGGDPDAEPLRGIHGPDRTYPELTEGEYSLDGFEYLLRRGAEERGISPPRLIKRYPFLTAGLPDTLPGIEELRSQADDSLVVMTGDLMHHGIAYGNSRSESLPLGPEALELARTSITQELDHLSRGEISEYVAVSRAIRNDSDSGGQLLYDLLGNFSYDLLDLTLCDTASMYDAQSPSWVATSLIGIQPHSSGSR